MVAAATFLMLPVIYFALSFVTHTLNVRYVLETVIGAANTTRPEPYTHLLPSLIPRSINI